MKTCPCCKESKTEESFGTRRHKYKEKTYVYTTAYCKECLAEKARKKYWANPKHAQAINRKAREKNPETYARNHRKALIKAKYGLTLGDVATMLAEQKGLCLICRLPMARPNIDHCHSTGRVRGLLCRKCNSGLGCFGDSKINLLNAIQYLEKH